MTLIKTGTDFYCEDANNNGAVIIVNEEWLQDEDELMIQIKMDISDMWLDPSEYKGFLTKIIDSITELEIIYGTQKVSN